MLDNPASGPLSRSVCRFYQWLIYCEAPLRFCVCRMWVSTSSKCVTPSLLSLVVSFIRGASLYCEPARLQLLVYTIVTVLGVVVASQRRVATLSNCCQCAFHSAVHYVTSTLFFPWGLTDQHKHLTHRHTIISHHVNKGAQWFKPYVPCFRFAFQKLKVFLKNLKIKAGCVICQVVHPTPKIKYESTNL